VGRLSGRAASGIWEQKGDRLRICYHGASEGRPEAFDLGATESRSGRLFVLERLSKPSDRPAGAVLRLGRSGLAHQDGVSCVEFSPDGRTLASGGHDRYVRLWNPATGE